MLFISCVALAKYRLRFPGFELPEPVRRAENEFEESLAHTLDGMADRLDRDGLPAVAGDFGNDFVRARSAGRIIDDDRRAFRG